MQSLSPLILAGLLWSLPLAAVDVEADTLCIKYTKELFVNDTATNELAFVTALVDLAVAGDANLGVQGILSPEGGLVGFFSGEAGPTTNRNGTAVIINFLDGLSTPDPSSNTAMLLSHLYQFFGSLLGCLAAGFPPYEGDADMYRVHKFMNATDEQNTFVITQLATSASVMGMSNADAMMFETLLDTLFGAPCAAPLEASGGAPDFLVGTNPTIVTADECQLASPSTPSNSSSTAPPSNSSSTAPPRIWLHLAFSFVLAALAILFK